MHYVSTTLLLQNDRALNKKGEKLESLCLIHEEKM